MKLRTWLSRILIIIVAAWNIQAAFFLLIQTETVTSSIQLPGPAGILTVRGIGILFLMWNIPYMAAAINPIRNRNSLIESLLMQFIALAGESLILRSTQALTFALETTMNTYIRFDAAGLVLLAAAMLVTMRIPDPRGTSPVLQ